MTTERRSMRSPDPQTSLEDLLRAFYAAEMPADLRRTTAAEGTVVRSGRIEPAPAGTRSGRRLGLTAMLTTLLLAASAFVLVPSAAPPTGHPGDESANQLPGTTPTDVAVDRLPVELQGAHGGSVPASAAPADEAGGEFPEFDIRILPIDADRR